MDNRDQRQISADFIDASDAVKAIADTLKECEQTDEVKRLLFAVYGIMGQIEVFERVLADVEPEQLDRR